MGQGCSRAVGCVFVVGPGHPLVFFQVPLVDSLNSGQVELKRCIYGYCVYMFGCSGVIWVIIVFQNVVRKSRELMSGC